MHEMLRRHVAEGPSREKGERLKASMEEDLSVSKRMLAEEA